MQDKLQNKNRPFGISLPKDLLELIDKKRGDVNRSRYITRILEKNTVNKGNKRDTDKKIGLSFAKSGKEHCKLDSPFNGCD